jgi:O-antigen/teichoic acid export membrane protein
MARRAAAIARGVTLQVAARVSGLPLSIVSLGIATRYLGAQGYGVLTAAVAFVGLFDTFTDLGVGTTIVRRASGAQQSSLSRLIGVNLGFSAWFAVPLTLLAAGIGALTYAHDHDAQLAVLIMAGGLLLDTLSSCVQPVFDVRVRYGAVAGAEFVSRLVTLAASLAVMFTDAGLLAMCAVQVLPQLARAVITTLATRGYLRLRFVFDAGETWSLLKESVPFAAIGLIAVIYWRADAVLLSLLSVPVQVAAYGVALALAFNLTVIPQVFSRSAMSTINETFATDRDRFRAAVGQGYRFLLLCSAAIVVLGIPLSARIITLVGSREYTALTTPVLRWFFVACALSFLTSIISNALIAAHEQRFLTWLSLGNLLANIVLNLILIPIFGAIGTGIALTATELSGVVFTQPTMRRIGAGLFPVGYLLRLVPGLAAALAAMWLTWSLPLVVPLAAGGVAYLLGALAGGAIPRPMRDTLLQALRPGSAKRAEPSAPDSVN